MTIDHLGDRCAAAGAASTVARIGIGERLSEKFVVTAFMRSETPEDAGFSPEDPMNRVTTNTFPTVSELCAVFWVSGLSSKNVARQLGRWLTALRKSVSVDFGDRVRTGGFQPGAACWPEPVVAVDTVGVFLLHV
jgi:hypothetical protein